MRSIDWIALLEQHRVEYVTRGPNVARGEVNIQCPFCGSADPSHHMGINLTTGFWSCWRNQNQHSGKSPLRLLMRLLHISYDQAREIAGLDTDTPDPGSFKDVANRLLRPEIKTAEKRDDLELPSEFRSIQPGSRAFDYLFKTRGFGEFTQAAIDKFSLRFAIDGPFKERVIFPYYEYHDLVTWSGRAIGEATVRYKTLSSGIGLKKTSQTLYNHDAVLGEGKALIVVEGPIDVLKLDIAGEPHGIRAVGLSTNTMADEQIFILEECFVRFGRIIIMLDSPTSLSVVDSMKLKNRLSHIPGVEFASVPYGRKDAGELLPREAIRYTQLLATRR